MHCHRHSRPADRPLRTRNRKPSPPGLVMVRRVRTIHDLRVKRTGPGVDPGSVDPGSVDSGGAHVTAGLNSGRRGLPRLRAWTTDAHEDTRMTTSPSPRRATPIRVSLCPSVDTCPGRWQRPAGGAQHRAPAGSWLPLRLNAAQLSRVSLSHPWGSLQTQGTLSHNQP